MVKARLTDVVNDKLSGPRAGRSPQAASTALTRGRRDRL